MDAYSISLPLNTDILPLYTVRIAGARVRYEERQRDRRHSAGQGSGRSGMLRC